jgi:hypothetical protein
VNSDTPVDRLAALWNAAPLWIALCVLIAVAVVAAWLLQRFMTARSPTRMPLAPPAAEGEPDAVDSSHIGFAPLVSDTPHRSRFDAERPAHGHDGGGARP